MTKKKDVRTRAEAKKLMWEYYRDNRNFLPKDIHVERESLISTIELGTAVKLAFDRAVQTVSGL